MKKTYAIDIRGKTKTWVFIVHENPKYIKEWQDDGLHIDEVVNIIPQWYVDLGLPVKLWCAIQDILKG